MNAYHQRHVALKVSYVGDDIQGLAIQKEHTNTVESYLFDALMKLHLIVDKDSCNYSRCGRYVDLI